LQLLKRGRQLRQPALQPSKTFHGRAHQELSTSFGFIEQLLIKCCAEHTGAIALTLTPREAHSIANDFVSDATAALLAE
jgi:hypothetical protein